MCDMVDCVRDINVCDWNNCVVNERLWLSV